MEPANILIHKGKSIKLLPLVAYAEAAHYYRLLPRMKSGKR
jgi:hypothetical protein